MPIATSVSFVVTTLRQDHVQGPNFLRGTLHLLVQNFAVVDVDSDPWSVQVKSQAAGDADKFL